MRSAPESSTSIAQHLRFRAEQHPHANAFRWFNDFDRIDTVTWLELHERASAVAAAIRARLSTQANSARSHVVLCLPQSLEFIAAIFGCFYAGCTAVPVYPPDSTKNMPRFHRIFEDSEAALIITTQAFAQKLEKFAAAVPHEIQPPHELPLLRIDALAQRDIDFDIVAPAREQLALLQYTSGTTSTPKGVMITHGQLLENERAASRAYQIGAMPHLVSWLPFYHDMGLMGGIFFPVFTGISATLLSPATFLRNPATWLRVISDTRATISGGPNFAFELCATRVADDVIDSLDLTHWRTAVCGAEMIRRDTVDKFIARFARAGFRASSFIASYGLAEATLYVTSSDYCDPQFAAPAGSVTQVVNCGSAQVGCVAIVDPQSCRRLPAETVGEIWIKTPSVGAGYWRQEQLSQQTFNASLVIGENGERGESGFMRSGDLGFMRADNLFVTGRLKELIILRGKNYAPQDIESVALASNTAFTGMQCAAFAVDGQAGEQLIVVQEVSRRLHNGQPLTHLQADIRLALRGTLAVEAEDIVLVKQNTLPRTSSGKLQRTQIKTLYQNRELDYMAAESSADIL